MRVGETGCHRSVSPSPSAIRGIASGPGLGGQGRCATAAGMRLGVQAQQQRVQVPVVASCAGEIEDFGELSLGYRPAGTGLLEVLPPARRGCPP